MHMFWPAAVVRCQAVVVVCCIVFSGCSGGVLVLQSIFCLVHVRVKKKHAATAQRLNSCRWEGVGVQI